jgi:putative holliday junction resolvase
MIIGVDYGRRRVGVAIADTETRFARPLEVIDTELVDPIERIGALVHEREVSEVVVGKPLNLSGNPGPAVDEQSVFVSHLSRSLPIPVIEYDERLSTVIAERGLRDAGVKGSDLKKMRDAVAASVILQGYMDSKTWH